MLCPEVTNPPVQGLYVLDKLTINIRLFPSIRTKERFSGEASTSSSRKMSFIGQWNHTHRNRSRQFYRSPPMIPIRYPLLAWLASSQ